jgi:hypothetical protein
MPSQHKVLLRKVFIYLRVSGFNVKQQKPLLRALGMGMGMGNN